MYYVRRRHQNDFFIQNNAIERLFRVSKITKRNEKSTNFHESLTLRQDRERRNKFNRFNRNRFDLDSFNHFRRISKDQNRQSQNRDDDAKSIEMQRQKSFEKRDQREKHVKNF